MTDPSLSRCLLVVLNWNELEVTSRLLERLEELGHAPANVVVVDNGSLDGSGQALRVRFPRFRHVANAENLGFTGGMNTGLRLALEEGFDKAILLNNDLRPSEGMLATMARTLEDHPRAAVVGAVILRQEEPPVVDHAAERLDLFTLRLGRRPLPPPGSPPQEADWVSGAAFMVRMAAVEELGFLDDAFFMYWEEVDFCLRARSQGWKVLLAPDARALHVDKGLDALAAVPLFLQWRNRWLLARRHVPWYGWPVLLTTTLLQITRDVLGRARAGLADSSWIPLLGSWDGLRGRTGRYRLEWVRAHGGALRQRHER